MSLSSCTHECEAMNLYCWFRAVLDAAPLKTSFLWQILSLNHFKNIFKESLFRLKHFISLLLFFFVCSFVVIFKDIKQNNQSFFCRSKKTKKTPSKKNPNKTKSRKDVLCSTHESHRNWKQTAPLIKGVGF